MTVSDITQSPAMAAQLMVGSTQIRDFGEDAIISCLDRCIAEIPLTELMLSIDDSALDLGRTISSRCIAKGIEVSAWTMVLADRKSGLPVLADVEDFSGRGGYGSTGAWEGMGKGEEKFLFACPTAVLEDDEGINAAIGSAKRIQATGLFLDRIRFPSPVNGLEFLGGCSCPRCRAEFRRQTGEQWPDLVSIAVRHAADGREGSRNFLEETGCALKFRSQRISAVVERYANAARDAGLRIGLDLFAPSLAGIVGQDYAALSHFADFIKPMLYCKAFGPAGLPLEFSCLFKGFLQSGVSRGNALDFIAELTGIQRDGIVNCVDGGTFPAEVAATEFARAKDLAAGMRGRLYAGIELVDHDAYATRLDRPALDAYLAAMEGESLALCWNILYIPRGHIDAVARRYHDGRKGYEVSI